jgi:hypothetical protein
MALNGFVCCDCVEKGRLKKPPPFPELFHVDPSGFPTLRSTDEEKERTHDEWEASGPCPHPYFKLLHHRLGNIAGIQWVRQALHQISRDPRKEYPVLLMKVVYSGSHCGDFLNLEEVRALDRELKALRKIDLAEIKLTQGELIFTPDAGTVDKTYWATAQEGEWAFLRGVFSSLEELVDASLSVGKPIAF